MKDAEISKNLLTAEEAEKLQASFQLQRDELEAQITAAKDIPQENLNSYFSELNASLQNLQRLYSASSPYLRIYYRKTHQDALHALQTRIQETEIKLMPPKRFVFKGSRTKAKNKLTVKNGDVKTPVKDKIIIDQVDGPNSCVYRDLSNTDVTIPASAVTGKAVLLSNIKNCKIEIFGSPSTIHLANLSETCVKCGPVTTSVFVENAKSCQFDLACQQLRIHETIDTDFYIHVTSKAIIEECRNVRFGTYRFSYPSLDEDFVKSGLNREINNWRDIDDFNWLVAGEQSPNWSLISNSV